MFQKNIKNLDMEFINESERHANNMAYLQKLGQQSCITGEQKTDSGRQPTPMPPPSRAIAEHIDVLKRGLRDAQTEDAMWAFIQIREEVLDIMREAIAFQTDRHSSAERLVKEYQGFLNECVK